MHGDLEYYIPRDKSYIMVPSFPLAVQWYIKYDPNVRWQRTCRHQLSSITHAVVRISGIEDRAMTLHRQYCTEPAMAGGIGSTSTSHLVD